MFIFAVFGFASMFAKGVPILKMTKKRCQIVILSHFFWMFAKNALSFLSNSAVSSISGRLSYVRLSDCSLRHFIMFAWCPVRSTSGTVFPCHSKGLVYCGCSRSPEKWLSSSKQSLSESTPGNILQTASATTSAGNSPPVKT